MIAIGKKAWTIREVGSMVAQSVQTVALWVSKGPARASIAPPRGRRATILLSIQDVAEVLAISRMRESGLPMATVRSVFSLVESIDRRLGDAETVLVQGTPGEVEVRRMADGGSNLFFAGNVQLVRERVDPKELEDLGVVLPVWAWREWLKTGQDLAEVFTDAQPADGAQIEVAMALPPGVIPTRIVVSGSSPDLKRLVAQYMRVPSDSPEAKSGEHGPREGPRGGGAAPA